MGVLGAQLASKHAHLALKASNYSTETAVYVTLTVKPV